MNMRYFKQLTSAAVMFLPLITIECNAQGPLASVQNFSLDPTNFFVTVIVTNSVANRTFNLLAYDGPPLGYGSSNEVWTRVSDCVMATGKTLVLLDKSSPLPYAGRTYTAGLTTLSCCSNPPSGECGTVLGANEVYAPYPYFTNPTISSLGMASSGTIPQIQVTFGEGLYTNSVPLGATSMQGYFRVWSSNNLPTNAIIQGTADVCF